MKSLARCYFWWPGLDKAIEDLVKKCKECQEQSALPPQTPEHPWEVPKTPWTRVHIDHAGPFLRHYFLILVDAHSRWLEVYIVPSTSSEATIKVLRHIFSTHGLPHQLVSDNGPSFTSQEFKKFMSLNGHLRMLLRRWKDHYTKELIDFFSLMELLLSLLLDNLHLNS